MVALPYDLIFRGYSLPQIKNQLEDDLESIREHQRQIHLKAINGRSSHEERKLMKRLKYEERLLLDRSDMLNFEDNNWFEYILVTMKPFKILTGITFLCILTLLSFSNFLNAADRLLNSKCG